MPQQFKTTLAAYAKGRRINAEAWNGFSRTYETPTLLLGFGVPVARGAGENGIIAFATVGFVGVAEAVAILPHTGEGFMQYDTVPVMEEGVIGVDVGSNVVVHGTAAAWNNTTKLWSNTGTIAVAVPGCYFESSGTGIVGLRVRKVA
jgi:hypothetical protein